MKKDIMKNYHLKNTLTEQDYFELKLNQFYQFKKYEKIGFKQTEQLFETNLICDNFETMSF